MVCAFAQDHGGSGETTMVGGEAEAQSTRFIDGTIPSFAHKSRYRSTVLEGLAKWCGHVLLQALGGRCMCIPHRCPKEAQATNKPIPSANLATSDHALELFAPADRS